MVGTSKILTVSYGTFSCTLEGFDDSFSTMKAIAEYFRDLAADDRYFGAEPPTPDAEMLARIAEREIARRVEARLDGTGVVLRAGSALAAPPQADAAASRTKDTQTPAREPAAGAHPMAMAEAMPGSETGADASPLLAVSEPDGAADMALQDDLVASFHEDDADEDDEATAEIEDDLEDDLEDDDYEVDYDSAGRSGAATAEDEDIFEADVGLTVAMPPAAQRPAPRQVMVAPPQTAPSDDDAILAGAMRGASTPAPAAKAAPQPAAAPQRTAPPAPAIPAHPDADSVAAKLQRIRAVVGRTAAARDAQTAEDEQAEAPAAATAAPSGLAAAMATAFDDDAEEPLTATKTAAAPVPPVAQDSAATGTEAAAQTDAAEPATATPAPIRARVIKMRRADFNKAVTGGLLETDAEGADDAPAAAPAAPTAIGLDWGDDDATEMDSDADLDDLYGDVSDSELAARLEDETDASLIADDEAELDDLARLDGHHAPSDLSDEDEADLLAELAEVEREMGLRAADASRTAPSEDDAEDAPATEQGHAAQTDDAEDAAEAQDEDDYDDLAQDDAETTVDDADMDDSHAIAADEDADDDRFEAMADEDDRAEADEDLSVAARHQDEADTDDDALDDEASSAPRVSLRNEADGLSLRPRRVQMPQGPDEDEDAVSRILSRADAKLSEPDANRRRAAITQLKAAVAAKEADGSLGKSTDSGEIESAFRKDLREVVRPRRPLTAEARTERPRAAPLKLVASQRVDLPKDAAPKGPVTPVRPRRVSQDEAKPVATNAKTGSFAEFAEEMGASSLGDLLEAAAAYTAFVEGSEDFSRPQLLNKIKESRGDISREDGLRSFGTLLREGRIMKVRNGRFQVSDETRFHPERRAG